MVLHISVFIEVDVRQWSIYLTLLLVSFQCKLLQYVPENLLPIYRDELIPLANIITPNQFEAE